MSGSDQTGYDLGRLAERYYAEGNTTEALALAEGNWSSAPKGSSEVFRFAMLANIRLARSAEKSNSPDARKYWAASKVQRMRAFAMAVRDGDAHVAALLMQPDFNQLIEMGYHDDARAVLDTMSLLVDDSQKYPTPKLLRRILSERRAYSYLEEGKNSESIEHWTKPKFPGYQS